MSLSTVTFVFRLCLFFLLSTPAFFAGLVVSLYIGPWWWLFCAVIATQLRYAASTFIYWDHTKANLGAATSYVAELADNYTLDAFPLSALFPAVHDYVGTSTAITVIVATPKPGAKPIEKFYAFTAPGTGSSLVIIGHHPKDVGPALYYLMLHEIGHAVFSGVSHALNARRPALALGTVYYPMLALVQWWPFQLFVFACLVWHTAIESKSDFAEMSADAFARHFMRTTRSDAQLELAETALAQRFAARGTQEARDRKEGLLQQVPYLPRSAPSPQSDWRRTILDTREISADWLSLATQERARLGPIYVCLAATVIAYIGDFPILDENMRDPSTLTGTALALLIPMWLFIFLTKRRQAAARAADGDYWKAVWRIQYRDVLRTPLSELLHLGDQRVAGRDPR